MTLDTTIMDQDQMMQRLTANPNDGEVDKAVKENFKKLLDALKFFYDSGITVTIKPTSNGWSCHLSKAKS